MDLASSAGSPTVGKCEHLDAGTYYFPINWSSNAFVSQADPGMSVAVYSGFDSRSVGQPLDFSCTTGNCTWAPYASLAVCSACNDVSRFVERQPPGSGYGGSDLAANAIPQNEGPSPRNNESFSRFSLPYMQISNYYGSYRPKNFGENVTAAPISDPRKSLSFQNSTLPIFLVGIMQASTSYSNGSVVWENSTVQAMECGLFLCTNVYTTHIVQGQLQEQILGSVAHKDMSSYDPDCTYYPCGTEGQDDLMNYPLISWNISDDVLRNDLRMFIPADEALAMGMQQQNATLNFSVSQAAIVSTTQWLYGDLFRGLPLLVYPSIYKDAPPVIQAIAQSTNVSQTFDRVAQRMTAWIRNQGGNPQIGTELRWELHFSAQWYFLTLPVITILSSYVFVVLSMMETKRLKLAIWKTDTFAALAHSLDSSSRRRLQKNGDSGGHET